MLTNNQYVVLEFARDGRLTGARPASSPEEVSRLVEENAALALGRPLLPLEIQRLHEDCQVEADGAYYGFLDVALE